jgi:hypothetical protein
MMLQDQQNGNMESTEGCGTVTTQACSSPAWPGCPGSPSTNGGGALVINTVDPNVSGANYTSPVYFQTTNGMTGMLPLMKSTDVEPGKCVAASGQPYYQPQAAVSLAYQLQYQHPAYVPIAITGHPAMDSRY